MAIKKVEGIATIDVALVVIRTKVNEETVEFAIETSNKVEVQPEVETTDAIKLIKLGKLLAQKKKRTTVTGHTITLTDNVFIPAFVQIIQGGTLEGTGVDMKYAPPVSGSSDSGRIFELDLYSAEYDASGQIVKYEKITYPNCQGEPITINTEDDVFRVSTYTITSAPKTGESAYKISYVSQLPAIETTGTESVAAVQSYSVGNNYPSVD